MKGMCLNCKDIHPAKDWLFPCPVCSPHLSVSHRILENQGPMSNCCGAPPLGEIEMGMCADCKEHCEFDNEVQNYFESLGYSYSFDYNRKLGEEWHEILDPDSKKVLFQIDKGVPLEYIVQDLTAWSRGEEATSPQDYKICCENDKDLTNLYIRMGLLQTI